MQQMGKILFGMIGGRTLFAAAVSCASVHVDCCVPGTWYFYSFQVYTKVIRYTKDPGTTSTCAVFRWDVF